jgi:hypothetical protein
MVRCVRQVMTVRGNDEKGARFHEIGTERRKGNTKTLSQSFLSHKMRKSNPAGLHVLRSFSLLHWFLSLRAPLCQGGLIP